MKFCFQLDYSVYGVTDTHGDDDLDYSIPITEDGDCDISIEWESDSDNSGELLNKTEANVNTITDLMARNCRRNFLRKRFFLLVVAGDSVVVTEE